MAVLEKKVTKKDTTLRENIALAVKTSAIVGSANFLLAGAVSSGLEILDRSGRHDISKVVSDLVKNPLLYIGVFGLAKAVHLIRDKNKN